MKDPKYLEWVRNLPCLTCANDESWVQRQPAHIRMGQSTMGRKPPDDMVVPLCPSCHHKQHSIGERPFWDGVKIDPKEVAGGLRALYEEFDGPKATELAEKFLWTKFQTIG